MDRWSILASVTFLGVLAGSYVLLSRPDLIGNDEDKSPEAAIGVEEFETEEFIDDSGMSPEDESHPASEPNPRLLRRHNASGTDTDASIEVIEDDESGETFDPPLEAEEDPSSNAASPGAPREEKNK